MDTFASAVNAFLSDPLVIPIISLFIVAVCNFLLAVYRAAQNGTFDWHKLPQILDTLVLRKVLPLSILGAAAFFVSDGAASAAMAVSYVAAATAALAAEVANLIRLVTNPSPDGGPTLPQG